ncbi:MAG: glycosyltransferase family 87 protein [Desulfobacterales bacterium]
MTRKILRIVGPLLVLAYFVTLVLHISAQSDQYQWDFRTHRKAAEIFAAGTDPYDPGILLGQKEANFLYTYPPFTLFFYALFNLTDDSTAFHGFLLVKCALLIGLALFWRYAFLGPAGDSLFFLFCLLVFNSAVFADLIAGNINLVEQVLLWVAFFFFLKQRYALFCVFVLLAASFKMTPIFFIVLLLTSDHPKKYHHFGYAGAIFLAYLTIQYLIYPDMFMGFVRNALTVVGESGAVGPSTEKFVKEIFALLSQLMGPVSPAVVSAVVIALAALVVFLSGKAYFLLKGTLNDDPDREKMILFLVCLVYALIHPRFKDYAYMLLIVPSYYIMKTTRLKNAFAFIFILSILAAPHLMLPGFDFLSTIMWRYFPLMIAYTIWGLYLHQIFSAAPHNRPTIESRV